MHAETPDSQTLLLVATAAGLFLGGLCAAVIGSIKLPMSRRLGMDEGRVGVLVASFSITFLPVVIISGWMIDSLGVRLVLLVCPRSDAAIGLSPACNVSGQFLQAICAAIFLSVAWSTLINVVHVMIPLAFPGSIVTGTNVADVFFSLGALTTPLLAAQMVRGETYRGLLFLIAGVATLAGGFCCLLLPTALAGTGGRGAGRGACRFYSIPRIWLCGIALCLFGPIETTFATWTSSYLVEKGYSDRVGTRMISGFWGASMISRLVVAFALPLLWFSAEETWIVLVLSIVATLVTLLIVIVSAPAAPRPGWSWPPGSPADHCFPPSWPFCFSALRFLDARPRPGNHPGDWKSGLHAHAARSSGWSPARRACSAVLSYSPSRASAWLPCRSRCCCTSDSPARYWPTTGQQVNSSPAIA